MPADFWAAVGVLSFVVAASLVVFGVWKLDLRLLAAGAALAGMVWLGIAFVTPREWVNQEFVTLHLRPVDAAGREMVEGAVVNAVQVTEAGSQTCRLPASLAAAAGASGQVLIVSLVAEIRVKGSLAEQYEQPAAHTEVVDQVLQIKAPGYRPWRGTLKQLLPRGWPTKTAESPVVVELQPE